MKKIIFIENLMVRSLKNRDNFIEVYPKNTELHLDDSTHVILAKVDGVNRPFNINDLRRSGIIKIEKIGNDFTT